MMEKRIGEKIREIRKKLGISQIELAERVGLSFQQIQKYEKGITRISVARLYQIAKALDTDIRIFFEEHKKPHHIMEKEQEYIPSPSLDEEERDLVNLFRNIDNEKIRQGIILILKGIVEAQKKE